MKKYTVLLFMSMILVLSLVGCGKKTPTCSVDNCNESIFKNELCTKHYQEEIFVGTWFAKYERQEDEGVTYKKGDKLTCTLEIYKGGTGRISWTDKGKDSSNVSLEWQVNDDGDILIVDYSIVGSERHVGFEYGEDGTLTRQDARYIVLEKQ